MPSVNGEASGTSKGKPRLSPGRRQYLHFKQQYQDSLLLFRMGDFYETFDEDAHTMADILGIALTSRDVGGGVKSALAGIPHHALDSYMAKLVRSGLKIAIAEQVSDPAASKGIVDRAVVRVVTPGTVQEPALLASGRNNYLAAAVSDGQRAGLAYIDISTSEFYTSEIPLAGQASEIERLAPSELLADGATRDVMARGNQGEPPQQEQMVLRDIDESRIDAEFAASLLKRHFEVESLEAFGCADSPVAVLAAGAVIDYLSGTQLGAMPQVTSLRTLHPGDYMTLDRRALRDLEVLEPSSGRSGAPSLLSTLDQTRTAPGARMLRGWLTRPLMELEAIHLRQDAVASFVDDNTRRQEMRESLRGIADMERLLNRARTFTATPRDLKSLGRSLDRIPRLLEIAGTPENEVKAGPLAGLKPCDEAAGLLTAAIDDDAPASLGANGAAGSASGAGDAIRAGFDPSLDEVRTLARDARGAIAAIESEARDVTGIKSLKVGYNRVFGYYIEVSRSNLDRVPEEFERRQTLTGGERFITPQLKELEAKILGASERIAELERSILRSVCGEIAAYGDRIMAAAAAIAWLDAISSMAETATKQNWVKPVVDDSDAIVVREGRHPVVEAALGPGRFVPNDTDLSSSGQQLAIITGPNMSGKSTYIRQVAVLALLAQTGSFVPAAEARFGLTDRIFTRAGLSDDIAGGQSTFMVEMVETASILNQATRRSLAVLDEIGRGTSTYDGLAIARAVAEHIHNDPRLGCKTLFATHYHEMTALADELPRAANFRVAVSEDGNEVVFLRRIVPGGADRSYGVHVARLAGMPQPVVARAWHLLEKLERDGRRPDSAVARQASEPQLPLFGTESAVARELRELRVDEMTPLEAINTLHRLQREASNESSQ
jgi:DNA mismatch repair protein MutS